MHKYIKITPNFHILLNPVKRFATEVNMTFSSGGAYFEKENQKGLTHLLEHTQILQTKKHNKNQLSTLLFEKDLYSNASTDLLTENIVISGHKDYVDDMLDLILEFSFNPVITQDALDQEKQIVLREIVQRKGEPNYRLWRLIAENIYKPGSKDLCEVSGNPEIVERAEIKDLYSIHVRILENSHFILSIVGGGVDEDNILKKASEYTKSLSSEKTHTIDWKAGNEFQDFKYKAIVSELAHSHCVVTMFIPCQVHFGNREIREIYSELFFYSREGFFFKKLREELGFVYSVYHGYDESLQMLRITMIGEIDNVEKLLTESINILKSASKLIKKERLDLIKNYYLKRQEIASDNPYTPINFISNTLLNYGVVQDYAEYLDQIRKIEYKSVIEFANNIITNIGKARLIVISSNQQIQNLKAENILTN